MLLHSILSFLHTRYFLVSYAYVSIESIDCILLSSLELNAILVTSAVNTLCFLLQNLCCDFNIDLFFMNSLIFSKTFCINFIFL